MRESLLEQPTHFLDQTFHFVVDSCAHAWEVIGPGGQLHPELFIESKGHLLLEGLLAVIIGYLLLGRSYKPSSTKKEAELCEQVPSELGHSRLSCQIHLVRQIMASAHNELAGVPRALVAAHASGWCSHNACDDRRLSSCVMNGHQSLSSQRCLQTVKSRHQSFQGTA